MEFIQLEQELKNLETTARTLGNLQLLYWLKQLQLAYDMLLERYAPLKVDDRAYLISTANLDGEHAPGWQGCFHFLRLGAACVVREVKVIDGHWRFFVTFEEESWIDRDSKRQLIGERHWFSFGEGYLAKEPPNLEP